MQKHIDVNRWKRKDTFNFFSQFEEPFFGVTVRIDCTLAYQYSRDMNRSFFLHYLYRSLKAANAIEAFRFRLLKGGPVVFDQVHASPTIIRSDGSFGFSYMNYTGDEEDFILAATKAIEQVQNTRALIPAVSGENVIHYAVLPWLDFTSLSHARHFRFNDSSPKITFGKAVERNGCYDMPVSIHVHHALMDGYEVAQFTEKFQGLMNTP